MITLSRLHAHVYQSAALDLFVRGPAACQRRYSFLLTAGGRNSPVTSPIALSRTDCPAHGPIKQQRIQAQAILRTMIDVTHMNMMHIRSHHTTTTTATTATNTTTVSQPVPPPPRARSHTYLHTLCIVLPDGPQQEVSKPVCERTRRD